MNKRKFFSMLAGAPFVPLAAAPVAVAAGIAPKGFERISCEHGDPGYIPYGKLCADKIRPKFFLDGVEQKQVLTADAREGWIKRWACGESGRIAVVNGEAVEEVVHGHVEIKLLPKT